MPGRIIRKFSAAVPESSLLTALRSVGLLDLPQVRLQWPASRLLSGQRFRHLDACTRVSILAKLSILFFFLFSTSGFPQSSSLADLILINGEIITVDESFSIHEALAVKDDRILAVGTNEDLKIHTGPSTRILDLGGKAVLPGLIDSHSHAASASITEFDHPVPTMESIEDVLDYVRSRAEVLDDGEWIRVSQVFITRLKEQRYPTREELDEAAPRNPVIFRTGPDASVNSLALERSGIDSNWAVDDGGSGYAEKDPVTGELTGVLRNCTRYLKYEPSEREPREEEHLQRLKQLLADYNRVGITTIAERNARPGQISLYDRLEEDDELTVRVYASRSLDTRRPMKQIEEEIKDIRVSVHFKEEGMLRVAAVKTFLDGGMLTGSAYMLEPWGTSDIYGISDPEYRGLRFIPQQKLVEIVSACMRNEVQFTAHSVGNAAVQSFIEACASLKGRFNIRAKRPVICHSNFMTREAVRRVAELGIGMDIQPAWLYLDGRTLIDHFGYDRLRWFQPLRALFSLGALAGGGSDHMQKIGARRSINFYDPWMGMWVSLKRQPRWLESSLHAEHALSVVEALRFYTINNAYLLFWEDRLGSLEKGKFADFIVVNQNPLTSAIDRIKDIQVEQTYLGGKLVYDRDNRERSVR